MFAFCLDELQRRQDHTFWDIRRIIKACWLKDQEESGTIPQNIYQDLLHRLTILFEATSSDERNFDVLNNLNSQIVEVPLLPQKYALQYFKLERNHLKAKLEYIQNYDCSKQTVEELEESVNTFEYLERLVYYIKFSVLEPLTPLK